MSLERRSKASSDSGICAFPRRRARTWARLYFRMGLLEVVVQVEAGIEVTVIQEVEVTQQTRTAMVAVAVTPQPHTRHPLSSRQSEGKMYSLLGTRAHLVPVQGSHHTCSRADIRRTCARPEQRWWDCVLCCEVYAWY